MGERILLRRVSGQFPTDEFPQVGEPFANVDNQALGCAFGDDEPLWYPGIKSDRDGGEGGWVLTDYKKFFSGGLTGSFGFNAEDQFGLTVAGNSVFRASATSITFQQNLVLESGQGITAGTGTFTSDVSIAGGLNVDRQVTFRGKVNFLGDLNLSLAAFAAGVIPTSYTPGDIFVAGSPHSWQKAQRLLYNSTYAGAILGADNSEAGVHIRTLSGKYSILVEGYPARGTLGATLDEIIGAEIGTSFSRASIGGYMNADGIFNTSVANVSRMTFDFNNYDKRGLLIEGPSQNYVASPNLSGANLGIVGSGGAGSLPTGWSVSNMPANTVITVQSIETHRGMPSIVIRFQGSNSSGSNLAARLNLSNPTVGAAGQQNWNASIYAKAESALVGPPSLTLNLRTVDSSGNVINGPVTSDNLILATNSMARYSTGRLAISAASFIDPYILFNVANGSNFDFIMRFAIPMVERMPVRTSPYLDPNRSGEILKLPATPRILRPTEGTVFLHFRPRIVMYNPNATLPTIWSANIDTSGSAQTDMLRLVIDPATGRVRYQSFVGTGLNVDLDLGLLTEDNIYKIAVAYKRNDYAGIMSGSGLGVQTDTVAEVPSILSAQWLGSDGIGNWAPMELIEFRTYRRRYSNTELTALVA